MSVKSVQIFPDEGSLSQEVIDGLEAANRTNGGTKCELFLDFFFIFPKSIVLQDIVVDSLTFDFMLQIICALHLNICEGGSYWKRMCKAMETCNDISM